VSKLDTRFHLVKASLNIETFDVVPRKEDMYNHWGSGYLSGVDSLIPVSGQHLFDEFPNNKASVYR
jgi:hypothetical protein